jgi:uncharacterized repeat protein (TIGR01451 family)
MLAIGGGFETKVDRAALQGEILTLSANVGKLNEEISRLESRKLELESIEIQIDAGYRRLTDLDAQLLQCESERCKSTPVYNFIGLFSSTPINPQGDIFTPQGVNAFLNPTPVLPPVEFRADLSIVKFSSVPQILQGGTMFFDLRGTNNGPDPATGVRITDTLPNGLNFQSATPSQGSCDDSGQIVECDTGVIEPGAAVDIRINVTAGSNFSGAVVNVGNIIGTTFDPNGANNSASSGVNVQAPTPGETDLRVVKTASAQTVQPGGPVSYTITVNNAGPAAATGVRVTDTIPAGLTVNTQTSSRGTCAQSGGQVQCDVGSLPAGESATITVTGTVSQSFSGTLANTATVTGGQTDPSTANNSSTATVNVPAAPVAADLRVVKTASPQSVQAGQTVTYTITVTNQGPGPTTGVRVVDTIPAGFTVTGTTATRGPCSQSGAEVRCDLGTVSVGTPETITVTGTVSQSATGQLSNTATATADQTDPQTANNTATAVVTITPTAAQADLAVTKSDSRDPVEGGSSFQYTLVVRNNGPSNAAQVVLTDTLPTGLAPNGVQPAGCTVDLNIIRCTVAELAAGQQMSFTINVRSVDSSASGTVTNRLEVTSGTSDPDPSDNTFNEPTTLTPRPGCALNIQPGTYFRSGGNCGTTGDSEVSCTSSSELRISNPTLNLTCDAQGRCGDNNVVFGEDNHRCGVTGSNTDFTVTCEELNTPNRCSESYRRR